MLKHPLKILGRNPKKWIISLQPMLKIRSIRRRSSMSIENPLQTLKVKEKVSRFIFRNSKDVKFLKCIQRLTNFLHKTPRQLADFQFKLEMIGKELLGITVTVICSLESLSSIEKFHNVYGYFSLFFESTD